MPQTAVVVGLSRPGDVEGEGGPAIGETTRGRTVPHSHLGGEGGDTCGEKQTVPCLRRRLCVWCACALGSHRREKHGGRTVPGGG